MLVRKRLQLKRVWMGRTSLLDIDSSGLARVASSLISVRLAEIGWCAPQNIILTGQTGWKAAECEEAHLNCLGRRAPTSCTNGSGRIPMGVGKNRRYLDVSYSFPSLLRTVEKTIEFYKTTSYCCEASIMCDIATKLVDLCLCFYCVIQAGEQEMTAIFEVTASCSPIYAAAPH